MSLVTLVAKKTFLLLDVLRLLSTQPQHVDPPDTRLVASHPCRYTPDCTVYVYDTKIEVAK